MKTIGELTNGDIIYGYLTKEPHKLLTLKVRRTELNRNDFHVYTYPDITCITFDSTDRFKHTAGCFTTSKDNFKAICAKHNYYLNKNKRLLKLYRNFSI